jgi:hypothetical protein
MQIKDPSSDQFRGDAIRKLSEELGKYFEMRGPPGLDRAIAGHWNETLGQREDAARQEREALTQDYRWYLALGGHQQAYREQLREFLKRCQERPGFEKTTCARRGMDDAIDRLELGVSDIASTIELGMPEKVRQQGCGTVSLGWNGAKDEPDAELLWEAGVRPIRLRPTAAHGLRTSGQLDDEDVRFFTHHLVREVLEVHELELPDFHYPDGLKYCEPPRQLEWSRSRVPPVETKELPEWMRDEQPAPGALVTEMELGRQSPELAELVDQVLCSGARAGHADFSKLSEEQRAQRAQAVGTLVDAVAARARLSREDVVEILVPLMIERQAHAKGPEECAANTAAVAYLLEHLSEH